MYALIDRLKRSSLNASFLSHSMNDGKIILLNLEEKDDGLLYEIDGLAASFIMLMQKKSSHEEIEAFFLEISNNFKVPLEVIEKDLRAFLDDMEARELIVQMSEI